VLNVDIFTIGNKFKADSGNIYEITTHLAEGNKINIELTLSEPAEVQDELLK
jgi:hypothetical protein